MTDIILSLEYKGLLSVQRSAHASQAFPGIICFDFKLLNPKGNRHVLAGLVLRLLFFSIWLILQVWSGTLVRLLFTSSLLTLLLHSNTITVQTCHCCGVKQFTTVLLTSPALVQMFYHKKITDVGIYFKQVHSGCAQLVFLNIVMCFFFYMS